MITQSQKDQIRKMAEEKWKSKDGQDSYRLGYHDGIIIGAETVLVRLDIDNSRLSNIMNRWFEDEQFTIDEAKRQILNAIRISG